MTRGQDSLVIESMRHGRPAAHAVERIDFSVLDLIVIEADETNASRMPPLLAEIDKASAGRTLWRGLGA